MDELEKSLFEKYGTRTISTEEIQEILERASKKGLIERKDIRPQPPMDATSLVEHISHLRRLFLINDGFSLDLSGDGLDLDSGRAGTDEEKVADKVLRAYFEYERTAYTISKVSRTAVMVTGIVLPCIAALFFMYTPKPY